MLTPFENDYAMVEILGLAIVTSPHAAEFEIRTIDELCFQAISKREYFDEEDDSEELDEEWGIQLWTNALLFDDALNGTDYSRYCYAYSASFIETLGEMEYLKKYWKNHLFGAEAYRQHYQQARETLRKELGRKKYFTKKPVHNLSEILEHAVDALNQLLGIDGESEVLEQMKTLGKEEEFRREITALQERLRKHI